MKNQPRDVTTLLVLLALLAIVLVGGGFYVFNSNDTPGPEITSSTSDMPIPNGSEESDKTTPGSGAPAIKWRLGERVGNLKVVSITPHNNDSPLGGDNVDVTFIGEEPVEGSVGVSETLGPSLFISEGALPCGSDSDRSNSRCDVVKIANSKDLGFDNLAGWVNIRGLVTTYTYISYPSEGAPAVILTGVVRK